MKSTYYVRVQLHGLRHYSRPQLRALAYCTVGWSDLPLFWDFRKWTPCCRSGIFLWVPFQKIAQARQIFHFQKVTGTLKMIYFHEICIKEHSPEKIKVFYFRPPKMSKMDKGKKLGSLHFELLKIKEYIPLWRRIQKCLIIIFAYFKVRVKISAPS